MKKSARVDQHGLKEFAVKNIEGESKARRQKVSVIFCRSGSVGEIIPNVANVFIKLNPSRGI